jgi:hypothetical protein
MSLEHPAALWLLALAVPITAFHYYRGRLRSLDVPLLAFWDAAADEDDRRSALRRLRHRASLAAGLAALAFLSLAVAGPRRSGDAARWALVIDASPGVPAAEAAARARDFVRGLAYGDRVACADPRIDWTDDLVEAARALQTPRRPALEDLAERVREWLAAGPDVRVLLVSDRGLPGSGDRVVEVRVGRPEDTVGWTGGALRGRTLTLTATSASSKREERDEILLVEGRERGRRRLVLEPGASLERSWTLGADVEGRVMVILEPGDAFAEDDRAAFEVSPPAAAPTLVFHAGRPSDLLLHALQVLKAEGRLTGDVLPAPIARWKELRPRLGEDAILIFDRCAPDPAPERGLVLVLGAPGPGRVLDKPEVVSWDREAPPSARLDYGGVALRRARLLPGGTRPLLAAAEGALATWESRGGRARMELGFALEESDLAARPTFLLMLANLLAWREAGGLRSYPAQARLGASLAPERPLWIHDGELLAIEGDRMDRLPVRDGFPEGTLRPGGGFLRLSAGGRSETVAANVFDRTRTDLRSREGPTPPPPPAPWPLRIPPRWLCLAAALVVLAAAAGAGRETGDARVGTI